MASHTSKLALPVNLLTYLRSKTSVDVDCLNLNGETEIQDLVGDANRFVVATDLGPFADCTSNQWEAYIQFCNPQNAALLKKSVTLAHQLQGEFLIVSVEELAVEIAMISLSLRIIPVISGSIHVMCNPLYSWDTDKVFETGHRFHRICRVLDPDFDLSRLIMKVPATWEGLQACSKLTTDGIKTLATTVFTMEQVVLAGEAGCISISPFAHELRAHLDTSYHDSAPILDLYLEAQQYYRQHGVSTKVKSCAFMTIDEIITMAGVDAMTLPGEVLEELSSMTDSQESLEARSVYHRAAQTPLAHFPRLSYINDKVKFHRAYTTNGRGKAKTEDSIAVFCGFQIQAEASVATSNNFNHSNENGLPEHVINGSVVESQIPVALTA